MDPVLRSGDEETAVLLMQQLLHFHGHDLAVDGIFGPETEAAVRTFQATHQDENKMALEIDGVVGSHTWWSLRNGVPEVLPSGFDPTVPPVAWAGGSARGRQALAFAMGDIKEGAGEQGGNNMGPWVKKYLETVGLPEGNAWCAAFVSWCFCRACGGKLAEMPFTPCATARGILKQFTDKGWAHEPDSGYQPKAGDLVFWWRVKETGWQGHVGLVHHAEGNVIYTIEGNKGPRVQGYSYQLSRMSKLLGFGAIP